MYTVEKDVEYFLARNTHYYHCNALYLVPREFENEWYSYLAMNKDDERMWSVPEYAIPWSGTLETLTFSNPHGGPIMKQDVTREYKPMTEAEIDAAAVRLDDFIIGHAGDDPLRD